MDSTKHYDEHAAAYIEQTGELDLQHLYDPFLKALKHPGAKLLDAGCGSGRDAAYFVKQGYQVVAFDGARAMAARAAQRLGFSVAHLRFEDLAAERAYDGIWACASLLHVPRAGQDDVARRLQRALHTGGILFASFKDGAGDRVHGGRLFCDYTTETITDSPWLQHFTLLDMWVSNDIRPQRGDERWLNLLLRKPK